MRIAVISLCILASAAHAADTWTTPHPGMRRLRRVTATQNINVLVVDLCAPGVSVRATKPGEKQRVVSSFATLVGAEAAVNGDFFSFDTYSTTGPAKGAGAAWGGADGNFTAPAQFGSHQVLLPNHTSTAGIASWAREVVSGHPSLIVDGVKKSYPTYALCTSVNPRTALGFTEDHTKLVLAVVDGRATGREGMTCTQLAALMAEFGATDAVNLDGGGSSTMWIKGSGVVSFPSDGAERVVANHLAVRATGSGEAPHCPLPARAARFVAADAPIEMIAGDHATFALEMANEGTAAWTSVELGTPDRTSAFDDGWADPMRPASAQAAPGQTARFEWSMRGPAVQTDTVFEESFQLVDGDVWFGPTQTFSILVHPRSAEDDEDKAGSSGCATSRTTGIGVALAMLLLRRRRRA